MFGNEIRMGGFKALTKYITRRRSRPASSSPRRKAATAAKTAPARSCANSSAYGSAAQAVIPQLRELIDEFNAQCKRGEYPSGELNDRRVAAVEAAIKSIRAATTHPQLRSIKDK